MIVFFIGRLLSQIGINVSHRLVKAVVRPIVSSSKIWFQNSICYFPPCVNRFRYMEFGYKYHLSISSEAQS